MTGTVATAAAIAMVVNTQGVPCAEARLSEVNTSSRVADAVLIRQPGAPQGESEGDTVDRTPRQVDAGRPGYAPVGMAAETATIAQSVQVIRIDDIARILDVEDPYDLGTTISELRQHLGEGEESLSDRLLSFASSSGTDPFLRILALDVVAGSLARKRRAEEMADVLARLLADNEAEEELLVAAIATAGRLPRRAKKSIRSQVERLKDRKPGRLHRAIGAFLQEV
jgi:hypothetical protein